MKIPAENLIKAMDILIANGIALDDAKDVLKDIGFALVEQNIFPERYRARCIQWDKTDDDGVTPLEIDLPSEVIVSFEDLMLDDNATEEEIEDAMSEYLVDNFGVCHNGFFFEKVS